jgi:hypothetical protein
MFSGNPIGKQVFVLGQMAKLTDLYNNFFLNIPILFIIQE